MPKQTLDKQALLELMGNPFWLGKRCSGAPPTAIRSVLAAKHTTPWHLFLKLAIDRDADDAALIAAWKRALSAILGLQAQYAWGSKQKRAKLAALAASPELLAAIQGVVAHSEDPRLDLLAVLVIDGSRESLDALVPHVTRATTANDTQLDRLERLKLHARKTPALDALFAEIDEALATRNAASPALALGPLLGLGRVDELWFHVTVDSRAVTSGGVPRVQARVTVDSRIPRWLRVGITRYDGNGFSTTSFSDDKQIANNLNLGRCIGDEIPSYLARAAKTLKIEWGTPRVVRSGLRGKQRELVTTWLLGAPAAKPRAKRKR